MTTDAAVMNALEENQSRSGYGASVPAPEGQGGSLKIDPNALDKKEGNAEYFNFWKNAKDYDHKIFAGHLSEDKLRADESWLKASKIIYNMVHGEEKNWDREVILNGWNEKTAAKKLADFGIDYMVNFNYQAWETAKVGFTLDDKTPDQQNALYFMMSAYDHKDWTAGTFGRAFIASVMDPLSLGTMAVGFALAPATGGASVPGAAALTKAGQLSFVVALRAAVANNLAKVGAKLPTAAAITTTIAKNTAARMTSNTAMGSALNMAVIGGVYSGVDTHIRQNVEIAGSKANNVDREYSLSQTAGGVLVGGAVGAGGGYAAGFIFKPVIDGMHNLSTKLGHSIKGRFNKKAAVDQATPDNAQTSQAAALATKDAKDPQTATTATKDAQDPKTPVVNEEIKVKRYPFKTTILPPVNMMKRTRDFTDYITESYYKHISGIFGGVLKNAEGKYDTSLIDPNALTSKIHKTAEDLQTLSGNLGKSVSRAAAEEKIITLKTTHTKNEQEIYQNLADLKTKLKSVQDRLTDKDFKDRQDITDGIRAKWQIPILNPMGTRPERIPGATMYWPGERINRADKNGVLKLEKFLQKQIDDIENVAKKESADVTKAITKIEEAIKNNASDSDLAKNIGEAASAIKKQADNLTHRVTDGDPLKVEIYQLGKTSFETFKDRMFQSRYAITPNADYREILIRSLREDYVNDAPRLTKIDRPVDQYQNAENLAMSIESFWDGRKSIDQTDAANLGKLVYDLYAIGMEHEALYALRHLFARRGGDVSKHGVDNLKIGNFVPSKFREEVKNAHQLTLGNTPLGDDKHFTNFMAALKKTVTDGDQRHHPGPIWRGGDREVYKLYSMATFMPRYSFRHRGNGIFAIPFKERYMNEPLAGWADRLFTFNYFMGKPIDEKATEAAFAANKRKYKRVFQEEWGPAWKVPLRIVGRPLNDLVAQPALTFGKYTSFGTLSQTSGKIALGAGLLWGIEEGLEWAFDTEFKVPGTDWQIDAGASIWAAQLAVIDNTTLAIGRFAVDKFAPEYTDYLDLEKNGVRSFVRSTLGDQPLDPNAKTGPVSKKDARAAIYDISHNDPQNPLYLPPTHPHYGNAVATLVKRNTVDPKDVSNVIQDALKLGAPAAAVAAAPAPAAVVADPAVDPAVAPAASADPAAPPVTPAVDPAVAPVDPAIAPAIAPITTTTTTTTTPTSPAKKEFFKSSSASGPERSVSESLSNLATLPGRTLKAAYTFDGDVPRDLEDGINVVGGALSGMFSAIGDLGSNLYNEKIEGGRWWLSGGIGAIGALMIGKWVQNIPIIKSIPFIGIISFILALPMLAKGAKAIMDGDVLRQGDSNKTHAPNIITTATRVSSVPSVSHTGQEVRKVLWEAPDDTSAISKVEAVDPDGPGPQKFAVQASGKDGKTLADMRMLQDWIGPGKDPIIISEKSLDTMGLKKEDFGYDAMTHDGVTLTKLQVEIDKAAKGFQNIFLGTPENYVPQ
ncbi:MAG: hypothetical protein IT559_06355 [Alphaproteobacteria bacterium]|nr:hypothetical protein [Alphaproteobacteria bacterium]